MPEQDDQKIITTKTQLPTEVAMDLVLARRVLASVVGTQEGIFTEGSDLTRTKEYGADVIRQAFTMVSEDILQTHSSLMRIWGVSYTYKPTSYGALALVHHRERSSELGGDPQALYMRLETEDDETVIEAYFPLVEPGQGFWGKDTRFFDLREGGRSVSAQDLMQEFTVDRFQHLWRGMRWTSANLLVWDGDLILPEDLDKGSQKP